MHTRDAVANYPLGSVYDAFRVYRSFQVGALSSKQFSPELLHVTPVRESTAFMSPNGHQVLIDGVRSREALFIQVVFSLREVFKNGGFSEVQIAAFRAHYLGFDLTRLWDGKLIYTDNDNLDKRMTYSLVDIAAYFHVSPRKVEKWCRSIREALDQELVRRGLLEPTSNEDLN